MLFQFIDPVDKWDGAAVRNALDDEVRCIVTHDYRMEEDHSLPDGRLAISVLAVAAAGWALLWDWWHPFPESRPVLVACVLSYFALMGILTLYTNYYEKGIFVVAKRKVSKDLSGRSEPCGSLFQSPKP